MNKNINRRKAISNILLLTGLGTAAVTGVKLRVLHRSPDLIKLNINKELIAELAETIIPATDTPGAKEAGVATFIIRMIEDCTPEKDQIKFLNGLQDVNDYALGKYSCSFIDCTPEQRYETVDHFEQRGRPYKGIAGKVYRKIFGNSFFTILKKYTVKGYCNSRTGITKGLAWNYIPGNYDGCLSLVKGQKCWATE